MELIHTQCVDDLQSGQLDFWSRELGVTLDALVSLEIGYHSLEYPHGISFPVRNVSDGRVVGLSIRRSDHQKRFVVGSSTEGIFRPTLLDKNRALFCPEGVSDTAALLSLGLQAIGRVSAGTDPSIPVRFAQRNGFRHFVAVADLDDSRIGQDAARILAYRAKAAGLESFLLIPPTKDVRQWVRQGASHQEIRNTMEAI